MHAVASDRTCSRTRTFSSVLHESSSFHNRSRQFGAHSYLYPGCRVLSHNPLLRDEPTDVVHPTINTDIAARRPCRLQQHSVMHFGQKLTSNRERPVEVISNDVELNDTRFTRPSGTRRQTSCRHLFYLHQASGSCVTTFPLITKPDYSICLMRLDESVMAACNKK